MTVFKGFLLLLKREAKSVSLYLVIFIAMAVMTQLSMGDNQPTSTFKSMSTRIAIEDKDQSDLSKSLVNYLEKTQSVKRDLNISTPDMIQENLYYSNVYSVIKIPKGFEKDYFDKQTPLTLINKPGFDSTYVTSQVDQFLKSVKVLHESGDTVAQAVQKVQRYDSQKSRVTLIAQNKSGGEMPYHNYLFQYLPYILISMTSYSLGIILIIYAEPDKKRRMLCAPVSYRSMNLQLMLGAAVIGTGLWLICGVALPTILSAKTFLSDPNLPYYLLNVGLMILVSLALSFLVSKLIQRINIISSVTNVLALGMSFLCGVFVPLSVLSPTIKKITQFLPVYWYEVTNELIGYQTTFNASQKWELYKGFGIQLLFVIALLSLGMLVGKLREQKI
ncbi:MAG: ABC transporter permease [Lactococcus chungangensis]|jgi:ABC-2 type transport system permease protein|uniref:ABC-2 type transport system permease protein n=3 Tax=Pseudolactococcus chungangensis TaxID=451457 RepID=A0A1K2H2Q2_9LACT|nr:ABC transporter permease [Lactococcus chungangensis]NLH35808.1 ABC transporter permease [Lactococcus chungangensis]SFZ70021.1 ABC-2 type transport system permease protein [Lactococcus chungangensis CAU 28 = DSM 22330]